MRNVKKLLCCFLALCMALALLPITALAADFTDTGSHWGKAAIDRWTGYGVLQGDGAGNFNPDKEMTRAEFASMLVKLMGYTKKAANTFSDVPADAWYADDILKLVEAGVMNGMGDGTANPNGSISREQAAVMLCRAMNIKARSSASVNSFSDGAYVSDWARDAVAALTERSMINGVGNNLFDPAGDINRASVASLVSQMVSDYVVEDGATITGAKDKIVIIKADNVKIENATLSEPVIVAPAAKDAKVSLTGTTSAADVIVEAEGAKVVVEETAKASSVQVAAPNAGADIAGKVDTVTVTDKAPDATVTVESTATVTDVTVEAKADVEVSGKVSNVNVSSTADGTKIETKAGAKIENVTTAADTTVTGAAGTVDNVTATGSADVDVNAPGADVKNETGGAGNVTANGQDVAPSNPSTPSTPSTPGTGTGTGTGGGTGSGGDHVTYLVTIDSSNIIGGTVTALYLQVEAGLDAWLKVTPSDDEHEVKSVTVTREDTGASVAVSELTPGSDTTVDGVQYTHTFTMPAANVTVTATFEADGPDIDDETTYSITVEGGTADPKSISTKGGGNVFEKDAKVTTLSPAADYKKVTTVTNLVVTMGTSTNNIAANFVYNADSGELTVAAENGFTVEGDLYISGVFEKDPDAPIPEDKEIDTVTVTVFGAEKVATLKVNDEVETTATVVTTEAGGMTASSVSWKYNNSDYADTTFTEGGIYTATVVLTIEEGYKLADTATYTVDDKTTSTGVTATPNDEDDPTTVTLTVEYEVAKLTPSVTMDGEPYTGNSAEKPILLSANEDAETHTVTLKVIAGSNVNAVSDTESVAYVSRETSGDFPTVTTTITITGVDAGTACITISRPEDSRFEELPATKVYVKVAGANDVAKVTINMPTEIDASKTLPTGELDGTYVTVDPENSATVSVEWDKDVISPLTAGEKYTATFTVTAADGKQLTADTVYSVNGEEYTQAPDTVEAGNNVELTEKKVEVTAKTLVKEVTITLEGDVTNLIAGKDTALPAVLIDGKTSSDEVDVSVYWTLDGSEDKVESITTAGTYKGTVTLTPKGNYMLNKDTEYTVGDTVSTANGYNSDGTVTMDKKLEFTVSKTAVKSVTITLDKDSITVGDDAPVAVVSDDPEGSVNVTIAWSLDGEEATLEKAGEYTATFTVKATGDYVLTENTKYYVGSDDQTGTDNLTPVEGSVELTDQTLTVTVAQKPATATFTSDDGTIEVSEIEDGEATVTVNLPEGTMVDAGDEVTVTIAPADNVTLDPEAIKITFVATAVENGDLIWVVADGTDTIDEDPDDDETDPKTIYTVKASGDADSGLADTIYTVSVTGGKFKTYKVAIAEGLESIISAAESARAGEQVTVTIKGKADDLVALIVTNEEGDTVLKVEGEAQQITFTMPNEAVTVTAVFKITVTVEDPGNGTVEVTKPEALDDPDDDQNETKLAIGAKPGKDVTLTISAKEGFELESLTVTYDGMEDNDDGEVDLDELAPDDEGNRTYTFTMPPAAVTVTATFTENSEKE